MTSQTYTGPERRMEEGHHDDICDRRLGWIKSSIFVIFVFLIGGGLIGFVSGQGIETDNQVQDERINENTKDIGEIKGAMTEHIRDQQRTNRETLELLHKISTDMAVIKRNVQ
jgi:hypothetical protein